MAKEFLIDYTEVYSRKYAVEADSFEEATEKLFEDIENGRERGPEDCVNSGFKDVTEEEEEQKLIFLTNTELSIVCDCILSMLERIDKATTLLYDKASIETLKESRLKYRNMLTAFTSVMD